jgi:hypothetical protein
MAVESIKNREKVELQMLRPSVFFERLQQSYNNAIRSMICRANIPITLPISNPPTYDEYY